MTYTHEAHNNTHGSMSNWTWESREQPFLFLLHLVSSTCRHIINHKVLCHVSPHMLSVQLLRFHHVWWTIILHQVSINVFYGCLLKTGSRWSLTKNNWVDDLPGLLAFFDILLLLGFNASSQSVSVSVWARQIGLLKCDESSVPYIFQFIAVLLVHLHCCRSIQIPKRIARNNWLYLYPFIPCLLFKCQLNFFVKEKLKYVNVHGL
jgi:hypothetical protein